VRLRNFLLTIAVLGVASPGGPGVLAARDILDIPPWLQAHVGTGKGQIAPVVLQRARNLYLQKVWEGKAKNSCYFAMDATRPAGFGRRFYVICEAKKSFHAISSGHGNGRRLKAANFANGRRCAKNFSNAEGSKLTTGGSYVTAETRTSRRKDPKSPYANKEGYVAWGRLQDYSAGRSNGCTSWTRAESDKIFALIKDKPTTVYIYPESSDIEKVTQAVKAGKSPAREGLYWNASCLREIRAPKFWSKEKLEPIIAKYRKARPPAPSRPLPLCKG
jgi:hypothetical protein